MTSSLPSVDLLFLLSDVLPALKPGSVRTRWLKHELALLEAMPEGVPLKSARLVDTLLRDLLAKNQKTGVGGKEEGQVLAAWHALVLKRWSPWSAANPWGWYALSLALFEQKANVVQELLESPGAPSGEVLSTHRLPPPPAYNTENAKNRILSATALGWAMRAGNPRSPHRLAVLNVLLAKGADPNLPVDDHGTTALGLVTEAKQAQAVMSAGGKLGGSVGVISWIPSQPTKGLKVVSERLRAWSETIRAGSPQLEAELKQHWPAIIQRCAVLLARANETQEVLRLDVIRQLRGLGRLWGEDCWRPLPGQASLAGEWAKAAVLCQSLDERQPLQDMMRRKSPELIFANGKLGTWSGTTSDGVTDGAWGFVLALLCQEENAHRQGPASLKAFLSPGAAWDWKEMGRVTAQMHPSPLLWNALSLLSKTLGTGSERDVMKGWVSDAVERTQRWGWENPLARLSGRKEWDLLGRLAALAAFEVRSAHQAGTAEHELQELTQGALVLMLWHGWRAPEAKPFLEFIESTGMGLDKPALAKAMKHPFAIANRNPTPVWEALSMEFSFAPAPVRPKVRM